MVAVSDTSVVRKSTKFVSQQWLTKEFQLNAGVSCPGKVFLQTLYYCSLYLEQTVLSVRCLLSN
jgi:hypothetical protein